MSWYEKLLPKRIRVNTDSSKRKIPEGFGRNVRIVELFFTERKYLITNMFVQIVIIT